jgi:hypothetical protein
MTSTIPEPEFTEFTRSLQSNGVHAALAYLNNRTPHRFTGIYRYDGTTLRNIFLYDKFDNGVQRGDDAPMEATYCSLVVAGGGSLEIMDASTDERVMGVVITPVVSYCGVLLVDRDGEPFGTLCHFDLNRCEARTGDLPLLKAASEMLFPYAEKAEKG